MGGVQRSARGVRSLGRDQDAYDRFSAAVELPLMAITIAWLPVLATRLDRLSGQMEDLLRPAKPGRPGAEPLI
jgi:hypothetical protein